MKRLTVGAARVDITPDRPLEMGGFVARVQPSAGVHDRLFARALYLSSEEGDVLWLHADCLGFDEQFLSELRQDVQINTGILEERVFLTATHTHSAPATITLTLAGQKDSDYMSWLKTRLLKGALMARAAAEPCTLVTGFGRCDLGVERRGDKSAPVARTITLSAFLRARGGGVSALVANYAIHNVALNHENRLLSGDIFGHAAALLESGLPGKPVCLILPGACANINPPDSAADFSLVSSYGQRVRKSIEDALAKAQKDEPLVGAVGRRVAIPLEKLRGSELDQRASVLKKPFEARTDYGSRRICNAIELWKRHMAEREQEGTASLNVQCVRVGSNVYALVGAELFSHMIVETPDVCPVGCAAGVFGYLAPRHVYEQGGYEVDLAFVFYDTQPLLPGGFELVAEAIRQLSACVS